MLSIFNFSTDYATDNSMDLVKVGAYKALLRSDIQSLPITYLDVFESLKYSITKMYVFSYQILSESLHRPIEDYMKGCGDYGAIFCSRPTSYRIIYNDIWPEDIKNWVLLSLYACAELDMVPINGLVKYSEDMDDAVNNFVYHFLSPDPVLKECGIYSAKDIAASCCMPLKNAVAKSRHLKRTRRDDDTLFDICLTYNFSSFIDSHK